MTNVLPHPELCLIAPPYAAAQYRPLAILPNHSTSLRLLQCAQARVRTQTAATEPARYSVLKRSQLQVASVSCKSAMYAACQVAGTVRGQRDREAVMSSDVECLMPTLSDAIRISLHKAAEMLLSVLIKVICILS